MRRLPVMEQPLVRGMAIGEEHSGDHCYGSEEELMGFTSMSTSVSEALEFARRGVAGGGGGGIVDAWSGGGGADVSSLNPYGEREVIVMLLDWQ